MSIHLFFSNNIETLAESFAEKVTAGHDLFNPSTIIVPNPYLQKWLQLRIADTQGISINNTFSFLNDGLWNTARSMTNLHEHIRQLDQIDLQLLLYTALTGFSGKDIRIKPLLEYLVSSGPRGTVSYEKKAWQLSSVLSRYFLEYEYYREEMIQYWLSGRLVYNTEMEASQQFLYNFIFCKNGLRDKVDNNLLTLPQYWKILYPVVNPELQRTLFLFGKSQLSPFHTRMIYELGKFITIYLYQVNPCFEFWEDVTTPGEDRWLRVKSIKIEERGEGLSLAHNENENYLLKLWGKSGRETIKLLSLLEEAGSKEMAATSEWLFPIQDTPSDSCLHLVQNQILNRVSTTDRALKIKRDTSIQIASCTDIFRETETVYNSILYNLSVNPGLNMSDIAIMVPDMNLYGPVIHSVFSQIPKRITYSMIDSTAAIDSLFGKAVSLLLDIAGGSFTRKTVFDLVFNQCFLDAHEMNIDDARICLSWADSLNIFHTYKKTEDIDPEHNLYTWQQGLQRLRFGRIIQTHNNYADDGIFLNYKHIVPFTDMNTGNLKLLDTFSGFIEHLYVKTKNLHQIITSGHEWVTIIKSLIDTFIIVPRDRPEEDIVYATLFSRMKKLFLINTLSSRQGGEGLPFSFVKEFLLENIIAISSTRGRYLSGGINISALVPKRQIPFKIIYVLGMQEGLFPGNADSSTLNIMNVRRHLADVSKPDANRYLFLETLLSTREKLYITYISRDLQKDQNFFPNSILGQFLTYLNNYVVIDEFSPIVIPSTGSSKDYLQNDLDSEHYSDLVSSRIQDKFQPTNYSLSDRLVLLQHAAISLKNNPTLSSEIKKKLLSVIPDYSILVENAATREENVSLSLRDISYYLHNPAESTLRWHLGIQEDSKEDRSANECEPFFSVFPYSYRFINDTLNYYIFNNSKHAIDSYMDDYYKHTRLMSATPPGAFGNVDFEAFKSIIHEKFYGTNNLSEFIKERNNYHLYRNLRFGTIGITAKPDITLPPLKFTIKRNNLIYNVDLSGFLPLLWIHPENVNTETLVITNSDKPSAAHLVGPFLFYVSASAGIDQNLAALFREGSFTIHVSCRKRISSYTYLLDQQTSRTYMNRLIYDFLDVNSFDNLPLSVISKYKILNPAGMKTEPSDSEKLIFHNLLTQFIDEEKEKFISSFRSSRIFDLLNAEVPFDAYDKVRDRLSLLFKPIAGKERQAHD